MTSFLPATRAARHVVAATLALLLVAMAPATWAVGSLDASSHPDFEPGLAAIRTQEWPVAIERFLIVVKGEPGNADAHNWLGYAYRKSGNLDLAFKHYREALRLDPKHLGAHEYIGEAYLMAGDRARAREHLDILARLCQKRCEEYRDLEKALAAAK